jgi:hypothetical protein
MNLLIADFGYGDVKYIVTDEEFKSFKKGKFPNAIARVSTFLNVSEYTEDNIIKFNGKKFLVGKEAIMHNPFTTRTFSYIKKYSPLLLAKIIITENIKELSGVVTGLALTDFNRKEEYIESLSTFSFDKRVVSIPQENILVMPQGYGIYLDFSHEKGEKIPQVLIVDIGYNTLDIGYVNEKGKFSLAMSRAYQNEGVIKITKALEEFIRTELTNVQLPEQDIKEALNRKRIKLSGVEHDLTEMVNELSEEYAEYVMNKLQADYEQILEKAEYVVFAGGGARYIKDYLKNMGNVFIPEEPEFSNVRGYYYGAKGE